MILAIDVGNTNIVLGLIREGSIEKIYRFHTNTQETDTEYAIKFSQLLEMLGVKPGELEGCIISSVVPQVTEVLKSALLGLTGAEPMVVGPGMKTGLNVRIDDPATLGADLAVGSIAALEYYGGPAIVIDLGTATTITLVDESRSFRGGAILPGIKISYGALTSGTSLLPQISIIPPKKVVATNTVDCMRSGAVYGTAAMIDGMIERMEEEFGKKCVIVATGGLASSVIPYCRHEIVCDDDLLLKGLWQLYLRNK